MKQHGGTLTEGGRSARSGYLGTMAGCVLAGLAYLGIGLATHHGWSGAIGLVIMLAYAALLTLARGRSETIGLLAGEVTDERRAAISQRALAFTANVLVLAIAAGAMVSLATSSPDFRVYGILASISAIAFAGSLAVFSRRG
jgi:uncharacterized membrane protein